MATQLPRPTTKTASRCTAQADQGTHAFEISGYSLHKGLGAGKFLRSAAFAVGGYEWCIRCYPDGVTGEDFKDYVASFLELMTKNAEVSVFFDLRLIDQTTRSSMSIFCSGRPVLFNTVDLSKNKCSWGSYKFMKMRQLEESSYLRDNRLVIECDVTIVKEATARVLEAEAEETNLIESSPSPSLSQDLDRLLRTKEGADVTFLVEGEVFSAHALVLAMRSSVFKAEFYGPLKEKREQHISIQDIQPDVFRALLHFIYTDSMIPSMADLDRDERRGLIQHLLVAADRYDVQGLKAACEKALCESLDVQTVAAMLALADQHNCCKLKSACMDFIICPDRWDGVAASEGFSHLKRSCPGILVDVLHKALKSRKI